MMMIFRGMIIIKLINKPRRGAIAPGGAIAEGGQGNTLANGSLQVNRVSLFI